MTSVAASIALVTTTPIWTALAARLDRRAAAGARCGGGWCWPSAGSALIAGVDVTVSLRALAGDGLALLGAIFAGGYVLAGARARERLSTSAYAVVCYSHLRAGGGRRGALVVDVPLAGFSARDWWLIAAITVLRPARSGTPLLNLVLSSVGPDGGQPGDPAGGAGRAAGRPGAAGAGCRRCSRCPGMALVVVGVALVVRASRPTTLVEPAT